MRKVVGSNSGEGYYIVFLLWCWRNEWKDRKEEFNGICNLRFFKEQEEVWINLLQEELPSTIIIICWILMCIRINKGFRWPEKRIPAMGVPNKKIKKKKLFYNEINFLKKNFWAKFFVHKWKYEMQLHFCAPYTFYEKIIL